MFIFPILDLILAFNYSNILTVFDIPVKINLEFYIWVHSVKLYKIFYTFKDYD